MVLVEVFRRLQPLHQKRLSVLHIHHGADSPHQVEFRNDARKIVRAYCKSHGLHFLTNTTMPKRRLHSEAESRTFRLQCFRSAIKFIQNRFGGSVRVLTAHHKDDVLETRLLQMIRGTGVQGFLSVHGLSQGRFLPLQAFSRDDLLAYAKERELNWVEDPSNSATDALRNWLRHVWLPELEGRHPGGVRQLGLSLDRLAAETEDAFLAKQAEFTALLASDGAVRRNKLGHWPFEKRAAFWAWYFKACGLRSYSENHVFEMLKRLDTTKKEFRFDLVGRNWVVDAQHIWLNPQASNL